MRELPVPIAHAEDSMRVELVFNSEKMDGVESLTKWCLCKFADACEQDKSMLIVRPQSGEVR